jgi:hypothetical protein
MFVGVGAAAAAAFTALDVAGEDDGSGIETGAALLVRKLFEVRFLDLEGAAAGEGEGGVGT